MTIRETIINETVKARMDADKLNLISVVIFTRSPFNTLEEKKSFFSAYLDAHEYIDFQFEKQRKIGNPCLVYLRESIVKEEDFCKDLRWIDSEDKFANKRQFKGDSMEIMKYIYHVNGCDFEDTEAFGKAWEDAKQKASKECCAVYRTTLKVILDEQVFMTCGAFNSIDKVAAEDIKVFG